MKHCIFIFGVALSYSSGVFAKDSWDQSNFSLNFGVGKSEHTNAMSLGWSEQGQDNSIDLGISYALNRYVSMELGYIDFGEAHLASYSTVVGDGEQLFFGTSDSFTAGKGYTASVTSSTGDWFSHFDVFITAGLIDWSVSQRTSGNLLSSDSSTFFLNAEQQSNGVDFFWGLGSSFAINKHLAISLSYEKYDMALRDSTLFSEPDGSSREIVDKQSFSVAAIKISYAL